LPIPKIPHVSGDYTAPPPPQKAITAKKPPAAVAQAPRGAPPAELTKPQLERLETLLTNRGRDGKIGPAIVKALNLADGAVRQIAVIDEGVRHGLLKPASGGYLFVHSAAGEVHLYHANARQKLMSGLLVRPNTLPTRIPAAEARAGLNDELAWWSKVATKLAAAP
jgi:hypothetical protein